MTTARSRASAFTTAAAQLDLTREPRRRTLIMRVTPAQFAEPVHRVGPIMQAAIFGKHIDREVEQPHLITSGRCGRASLSNACEAPAIRPTSRRPASCLRTGKPALPYSSSGAVALASGDFAQAQAELGDEHLRRLRADFALFSDRLDVGERRIEEHFGELRQAEIEAQKMRSSAAERGPENASGLLRPSPLRPKIGGSHASSAATSIAASATRPGASAPLVRRSREE